MISIVQLDRYKKIYTMLFSLLSLHTGICRFQTPDVWQVAAFDPDNMNPSLHTKEATVSTGYPSNTLDKSYSTSPF